MMINISFSPHTKHVMGTHVSWRNKALDNKNGGEWRRMMINIFLFPYKSCYRHSCVMEKQSCR